ncbi:MAG: DUF359 domain-containing protein [Candidatus Micrarchaeota archaeon]
MDNKLREILSKPFGPVMKVEEVISKLGKEKMKLVIAIGDESVYNLLINDIMPDVGIFDFKVKRERVPEEWIRVIQKSAGNAIKIKNPAGEITSELEKEVKETVENGKGWIEIIGEEDLAALPALAYAPEGALILYGQPDEGIVWLEISEENKKKGNELLGKIRE